MARFPWDLIESGSRLGLRTLVLAKELGGGGADTLTEAIATEELSAGDMGLAQTFRAHWLYTYIFNYVATQEQRDRFLPELLEDHRYILAGAVTEPETGSDNSLPYDAPEAGPHTLAVREGDRYILNGRKTLISNGAIARLYCIFARTDPSRPPSESTSCFFVPADTPGFSIGHVFDKLGQRLATNAELIMENCAIPATNLIGEENGSHAFRHLVGRSNPAMAAAQAIGAARGAFEAALQRARERVQGGKHLVEHQSIAMMLAEMATGLEAARTLVWRACWSIDHQQPYDPALGMMAKVLATETAAKVTLRAIEIFGGYGIMQDYPVEKYFRDAATLFHPAGTNQVLLLKVARMLADPTTAAGVAGQAI